MIIDAVTLFNELDLLELRLSELAPVVDRFVIVEANRTHKGTLKPLYYAENKARFAEWHDKIVHVVCPLGDDGDGLPAIRRREMQQRNSILEGIRDCADDDILLISDCDELPRSHLIPTHLDDGMIAVYLQKLYYYNLNTFAPDRPWPGTRVCRVADARAMSTSRAFCSPRCSCPWAPSVTDGDANPSSSSGSSSSCPSSSSTSSSQARL